MISPAAWGYDAVKAVRGAECKDNEVSLEALRGALIDAAKLEFTMATMELARNGKLGDEAFKHYDAADDKKKPNLTPLFEATRYVLGDAGMAALKKHDIIITIKDGALLPPATGNLPNLRAVRLLNGKDGGWATIQCKSSGPKPPPKPEVEAFPLIVGKTKDDVIKDADKRDFAQLAVQSQDGDTTAMVNLVLALPLSDTFVQGVDWAPFMEFNRKTNDDPAKEINQVRFGSRFTYSLLPWTVWHTDVDWQTDDRGHASVWGLETLVVLPNPNGSPCVDDKDGVFIHCGLTLAADYVDVRDPGANPNWATKREYTRLGGDAKFTVGYAPGDDAYSFTASYRARFDVSEEDATAELLAFELGYEPDKAGRFKFSLGYSVGKDLGTLADTDTVAFSIGYRQ